MRMGYVSDKKRNKHYRDANQRCIDKYLLSFPAILRTELGLRDGIGLADGRTEVEDSLHAKARTEMHEALKKSVRGKKYREK